MADQQSVRKSDTEGCQGEVLIRLEEGGVVVGWAGVAGTAFPATDKSEGNQWIVPSRPKAPV